MNILTKWFKNKNIKEKHMNHFSEEYLEKLVAEHKLKSAALARLKGPEYNNISRVHGVSSVNNAVVNLSASRVELEAQIDVLTEFLRG